jgi:hypothetical protein
MPSRTSTHPLLRELKVLQATESTLGQRYQRLRRAKHPRRAAILQFVTGLVRLQLRLEDLNRTLNAMGQIASSS